MRMALIGQSRCSVDPIELTRGGTSYAIDTVHAFKMRYPGVDFFFLIGADHVSQLPLWRDAESLATLVEFVVIPRPGSPPASLPKPYRITHLKGWPMAVSSSEIRDRIRRGLTIHHLVPDSVAEELSKSALYPGDDIWGARTPDR